MYLDGDRLQAIDVEAYRAQSPFPWLNPTGLLTEEGYRRLLKTLPHQTLFTPVFGKQRADGKQSHDRFSLEYHEGLPISPPWQEFIGELRGHAYRDFLRRLLGVRSFELLFYWHYTPRGCSVSPHCDSRRKLGGHIFYFNTCEDWAPAWGGETLILDDGGKLHFHSAPDFADFQHITPVTALGNWSLLFTKTSHSWHGVRALQCPEGYVRKVFIVVVNRFTPLDRLKRALGKSAKGYD